MSAILAHRYMFSASPLHPVVVVAVEGGAGDWAAYIAGMPTYSEPLPEFLDRIAREGAKLTEEQANGFFPSVDLMYRS